MDLVATVMLDAVDIDEFVQDLARMMQGTGLFEASSG